MTTQQLLWATFGYAAAFFAVVYFTRAGARRLLGALVGGAVAGGVFCFAFLLGLTIGLWRAALPAGSLALFYAGTSISLMPIYPITWRVARRFGRRGLMTCVVVAAVIGPPRDYLFAAVRPDWIVFAPGLVPVLAVSATYAGFVALGHFAMRLVAGPARGDRLVQRRWEGA